MSHYPGIHLNSAAILSKKPGPPQFADGLGEYEYFASHRIYF